MRWLLLALLALVPSLAMAQPPLVAAVIYAAAAYAGYITVAQAIIMIAMTVYGAVSAKEKARRARNQARDAYNASLQDRTVNIISTQAPWQIIYGEPVVGGTIVATLTSGDKDQFKHLVVVWAAHECEAITDFFINGISVGALDATGRVTSGKYFTQGTDTQSITVTFNSLGVAEIGEIGAVRVVSITRGRYYYDGSHATLDGLQIRLDAATAAALAGLDARVTLDCNGGAIPRVRVRHHLGTATQTADDLTVAECSPDWTSYDRGLGLCYSIVRLDLNEPEFLSGPPQMTARIKGRKVYDHRTGVTAWSSNPALCTADFLMAEWGKRAVNSQLLWDTVDASANACDELLLLHNTDKRYTCNGSFTTDRDPDETLNALCQSMAGFVTYGGSYHMQAGVWTAPVMDLGDADNAGSVEGVPDDSMLQAFNGLRGQFFDPVRVDQLTDYTPYQNDGFVTADGGELWDTLNLPFTNSNWRAHNLARIQVERSRGMTLVVPCKRKALKLRVGNRVRYSNSLLGISLAEFRVVKKEYRLGQPVVLTLQQDSQFNYNEVDDPPGAFDSPAVYLPDPFRVHEVRNLAASSGTATLIMQADGTVLSRIKLTFDASDETLVTSSGALQIEYRRDADTLWQRAPEESGSATQAWLLGCEEGQTYVIRARWRNSMGVTGDWRSCSVLHVGKSELPAAVAGLTLAVLPGALRGRRTRSTEADYSHTIYRHGATFAGGTDVPGTKDADGFVWPWPAPGTYTIWAADVDASGNVGPTVSAAVAVSATALAPANAALSIKLNVNDFAGTVNYSEAYIHGRDGSGAPIDAPGSIMVNGVATAVPNGQLNTNQGPVAGYIVWDSLGATFNTGPGLRNYVLGRRRAGVWEYDDNALAGSATGWTSFTPTATHWIIGTLESGGPDAGNPGSPPGLIAASLWAAASTLNAITATADAAYAAAAAAQGTADTAATNATSALSTLATMRSNGYLDASEKPAIIKAWQAIYDERTGIASQGATYGLTSLRTAYLAAFDALQTYLSGLSPSWSDTTTDTPITPATDQATWSAYYSARQTLLNAIYDETAKRANWSQVANRPSDDSIRNNMIDVGWWKQDVAIPWSVNGEYNRLVNTSPSGGADLSLPGPRGGNDCVWYCSESTGDGNAGGGWNGPQLILDPTRAYRFVVPIRRLGGSASAYWGTNNVCQLNTSVMDGNPYFAANGSLATDRWYLFVGFIYPAASTGNSHDSAGIWDCRTGERVAGGNNWCFPSGGGSVNHRAYQFYASPGATQAFGRPMVNVVDGTEPSLREYFEAGAVLNSVLVPSITAAQAAADAAQGTANTAATNASNALSTLATMRSNGYIDASEKPALIKQYQAVYDEHSGIDAQAATFGITTERTTWGNAYAALGTYLGGLSPSWNDTTTDTPITPATDNAKWADYFSTRQALLNAIAAKAKQLADAAQAAAEAAADDAADALAAAVGAQSTADGKIQSFRQDTAPSGQGESEGDIWFDTNDGNRQYVYATGVWVVAADTRIGDAILAAAGAQSTADGRVSTFFASSAPTANAVGDLWFNTTAGSKRVSRWNGSSWVVQTVLGDSDVGTDQIAGNAVTARLSSVSNNTYPIGINTDNIGIDGIYYTPSVDCTVDLTCNFDGVCDNGWDAGSSSYRLFACPSSDLTSTVWGENTRALGGSAVYGPYHRLGTSRQMTNLSTSFDLSAGTQYWLGLSGNGSNPGPGIQIRAWVYRLQSLGLVRKR